MTTWQKRARLGVAAVGVATVVVVYFAMHSRQPAASPATVTRVDPQASIESESGFLQRLRGDREDFDIHFERQLTYPDGSSHMEQVRITVRKQDGRTFEVHAGSATAGRNQQALTLSKDVKVAVSDGFELETTAATYNQDEGIVRSDDAVTFRKGRMHGSGVGLTYDKTSDVLTMAADAHIVMADERGATTMELNAGSAVLDRLQDQLTLDRVVHVHRNEQIIDATAATAHLSPQEEFVTRLELRGEARVQGGGAGPETMSAREIDLDYGDSGQVLQHATLRGQSSIAMTGANGHDGRQFQAEALDVAFAADGSVTQASGREGAQIGLPAAEGSGARVVAARRFDASGREGAGLTAAEFAENVVFREDHPQGAPRVVNARSLRLDLDGDAVKEAVFTGAVTFEEQGLRAGGATARYAPEAGRLALSGSDSGGGPCVADSQIAIEAQAIDVTLDSRRMSARGAVKTALHPTAKVCGLTPARQTRDSGRLPGLLKQEQPANVAADRLEYGGEKGDATYTGSALLWQGDTSVRGDEIVIEQGSGNLRVTGHATGSARAAVMIDDDLSLARATSIRYDDATRVISYEEKAPALAQLSTAGANDLRARRIEVYLADSGSQADRIEAYDDVTAKISTRTATGARLTYRGATGTYDVRGVNGSTVKVVDACNEISGSTLTFEKSTDRIVVDGVESRTKMTSGGTCRQPARAPAR